MTTRTRTPFPAPSSQRAAASPGGEASGLIDIRTLGAVLANEAAPAAPSRPTPAAEVPLFSGLSLTPVIEPPTQRPPTDSHKPLPRSQGPIYALLGALSLAMLGLAGYVVASPLPPGQAIVRLVPVVAPQAPEEPEAEPVKTVEPETPEEPAAPEATTHEKPKARPGKPVAKPKASPVADTPKTEAPKAEAPKPEPKAEYGVDCLLGKASCGERPKPAPEVKTEAPPATSDLPEKLEQADISAGTSAARAAAASSCARLAKGGEKVQIKLSIAGPSGAVIAASPTEDAGNPQLAACCATELKQASFRKVQKAQIGTVVTVKF